MTAVGRSGGQAVGGGVALVVLILYPTTRLSAQISLQVAAGVRYSSTLVHDSIVAPFDVRPALAPVAAITVAGPRERSWTPTVTLDFSMSNLERHDRDGTTATLGQVTTIAFTVGLTRPLPGGFSASIGVGGLKYLPSDDTGIFRSGSGAIAGVGALTLGHPFPIGGQRLTLAARYDIHGFTTPALEDEGFHGLRAVHRVALTLRSDWDAGR